MRQRAEEMEAYSGSSGHYTMHDIKLAASDVKSWIHGCVQIAVVTILYGMRRRHVYYILSDSSADKCDCRIRYLPPHHHQRRIQVHHGSSPISGHPSQPLGCGRLRRGRDPVRQVHFAFSAAYHLRPDWHCGLRDPARPCVRISSLLRNVPGRHGLLLVHWWKHVRSSTWLNDIF